MSAGRYTFTPKIKNFTAYSTTDISARIFFAIENGVIPFTVHISKDGERLDTLAGKFYNSATLWWVIAAASGIGWGVQMPPGTVLRIPSDLSRILTLARR